MGQAKNRKAEIAKLKMNTKPVGALSDDDIDYLCSLNANLLSTMFEQEVDSLTAYFSDEEFVSVPRVAYDDTIVLSQQELRTAAELCAYATLNTMAAEVHGKHGNLIPLYAQGWSDAQIQNSGRNYHNIRNSNRYTANIHRVLD